MQADIQSSLVRYADRLGKFRSWKRGEETKPHKRLLLLSVIRLLETDSNHPNRFTFDELKPVFGDIWEECGIGSRSEAFLEYPFYHMSSEGFWHFKIREGAESLFQLFKDSRQPKYRFTALRIRETIEYAYLDDELYLLLTKSESRCQMKEIIESSRQDQEVEHLEVNEPTSLFQHESSAIGSIASGIRRYSLGKAVNNLLLYDEATNDYYECDVIIVGYSGIYLVELKHWSGHIQIASYNWIKDQVKYRRDPHATNIFKAKILKGIYQHQFRTYPAELRVESVVVLTNPEAEVVGASSPKTDKHCPTFDSIEGLLDYLRHQNATKARLLSLREIERIADYLESLRQPKRESRYAIPGYDVVEHLTQRPDLVEVVARPTTGRYRRLLRFRVFFPPTKAGPDEKERFAKRARNTLDAVSQIGDHPNVLRVWPVPDESGALIEGSDWSEEGTLRDWILNRTEGVREAEALPICSGILRAVEAAHGKGVIHRSVKPENVLMVSGEPKLMNFDLSYQLASEQHVTVIPDVSVLKRDAYTAPEVYAKKDVDESTDLFSIGVILYELLAGERPFKASTDLDRFGGRLTTDSLSKLQAKGISEHVIETIERLVRSERTERIRDTGTALSMLQGPRAAIAEPARRGTPNQKLDSGTIYDVYTIEKLIGEGTEAQVYEARTMRNEPVALKIFNRDIPLPRILDEELATGAVKSSYLVQAKRFGHGNNDRYFIEMNLVNGRLMREEIREGKRPDKETFVRVASCLLEAVHALHHRQEGDQRIPLLHCDIKPDNIILKPDGGAVLFDFGCAGPPRVDSYQGTEGYVAPDLMSGADLQFCESGDLFALGVSLFEWLCGTRPYIRARLEQTPSVSVDIQPDLPRPFFDWLLMAVATESSLRFRDINAMKESFQARLQETLAAEEPAPPEQLIAEQTFETAAEPMVQVSAAEQPGNPFVGYLNSLHNASVNNENALAESQALSSYFGYIHVPLKVTDHIYGQLADEQGPHVILTGHAGDGKSTIGLELFKRAKGLAHEEPLDEKMRPREVIHIEGREVILIKDMSELKECDRLELLKDSCSPEDRRYFIISNTGTLLNAFKELAPKTEWHSLQNQLLMALESGVPKDFHYREGRFQLINLVRTDNISTACRIFERMLAPERWELCETSGCREECPIYDNVRMLREHWDTVIHRVGLAYRRLFEYGSRLTLRQITGHLAYGITAGLGYDDIGRLAEKAKRPPLRQFLFFNRFFGDCGEIPDPSADQLKAAREVRSLEPGRRTHRRLERLLWTAEESGELPTVGHSVKAIYDHLRKAGAGLIHVDTLPHESARMQVRRLLFFFGDFKREEAERNYISTFLSSPMLVDFTKWQNGGGSLTLLERKRLKQGILHVLQEHFTGIRLPENAGDHETIYITLNRHNYEIRQSAQIVLAKFQADTFDLILQPFDPGIGDIRYEPKIRESTAGKVLPLDLPFLDYVTNRFHGEIAQRLQSFYADRLEHFKVELLGAKKDDQGQNMMLIRLQLNHRFKSQTLSVHDKVLEVI